MLLFCPTCSNALTVVSSQATQPAAGGGTSGTSGPTISNNPAENRLECLTCPYQHHVEDKLIFERKVFQRAQREDVFGGPGAWDNAQKASVQCPNESCNGEEAAFFQVQIRSADEPMTSFFKCMTCHHGWREN